MGLIIDSNISSIDRLLKDHIEIHHDTGSKNIPKILILNLMPNKMETEYELLKLLGKSIVDIKVDFLYTETYEPRNVMVSYLKKAYKTLDMVKKSNYDGMIITGAPLEFVDFDHIKYWKELQDIIDYSNKHIKSTIYLCWAVVAGLYHNYKIPKHTIEKKIAGVFHNKIKDSKIPLLKRCKDELLSPHSRYFEIKKEDIEEIQELEILSQSEEAGIYIIAHKSGKQIYITGHPEYSKDTLVHEYTRDLSKGLSPNLPKNYFPNDNIDLDPKDTWSNHSQYLIDNWIRHYIR